MQHSEQQCSTATMLECAAASLHQRSKAKMQLGAERVLPECPTRELPERAAPGAAARVPQCSEPTVPERSAPELPVCAEATVFQRAGGELQQRAKAELPVGASAELPASAKRAVPGCSASVHWRQVDGPQKAFSGSKVHLFVTQYIWTCDIHLLHRQVDGPKALSDRSCSANVVLGGLHHY